MKTPRDGTDVTDLAPVWRSIQAQTVRTSIYGRAIRLYHAQACTFAHALVSYGAKGKLAGGSFHRKASAPTDAMDWLAMFGSGLRACDGTATPLGPEARCPNTRASFAAVLI